MLTGDDRHRFLNGLVTCEVRQLEVGDGAYGFFTDRQGRTLADVAVFASEEALALDLPAVRAEAILEHLAKYKVADRVELTTAAEESEIIVAGNTSAEVLEALLGSPPPRRAWTWRRIDALAVHCERLIGVLSLRCRGEAETVTDLGERIAAAGGVEANADAVDAVRVERGAPWFGIDFDESCFPQETGLESEAVSFSKGCYLGQEIVARIHYRGHVNRHLRALQAAPTVDPVAGDDVLLNDEFVGSISTTAESPVLGSRVALALLHRKAAPGESVRLGSGGLATVMELPLVSPEAD